MFSFSRLSISRQELSEHHVSLLKESLPSVITSSHKVFLHETKRTLDLQFIAYLIRNKSI